ncbi:M20/M25/M40 family metallo-hydrolase [Enterovibrio coralii]|uniref:M20/M25/M40 family metallo-hydrolase n=1 Tax=Enterovibrio coralii TaxID=294935 RepID=UPI000B15BC7E|nr:M20/M25/M40 family metallo-hydrolase [Enterovibrio coralii]
MFNPILFRHRLHKQPELSGYEKNTSDVIVQTLTSFGLKPISGVGGYGVVVVIKSTEDGPNLLFRADTDALPIHEVPCHEHGSEIHGVMHACGHDGHAASLMALAYKLSQTKLQRGSVTLIFQPSEENGQGALA